VSAVSHIRAPSIGIGRAISRCHQGGTPDRQVHRTGIYSRTSPANPNDRSLRPGGKAIRNETVRGKRVTETRSWRPDRLLHGACFQDIEPSTTSSNRRVIRHSGLLFETMHLGWSLLGIVSRIDARCRHARAPGTPGRKGRWFERPWAEGPWIDKHSFGATRSRPPGATDSNCVRCQRRIMSATISSAMAENSRERAREAPSTACRGDEIAIQRAYRSTSLFLRMIVSRSLSLPLEPGRSLDLVQSIWADRLPVFRRAAASSRTRTPATFLSGSLAIVSWTGTELAASWPRARDRP